MPPSVQATTKDSTSNASSVSRWRLVFLLVTATVASGLGIALGSTLRFQVLSVSEASFFKPQQDFPPLAEWPPQVPLAKEHVDFETDWENEIPTQPLIYNDFPGEDAESIPDDRIYGEDYAPEAAITSDIVSDPAPAGLDDEDTTQDTTVEVLDDESSPPVVSTSTGDLEDESDSIDELSNDEDSLTTPSPPWFDKQPASEAQFRDTPLIISPDDPSLYPYSLPE
ncbi:MAG: hypothetical protein AAGI69_23075 [Cyanobacteria bacterium P01_H01_bin.21]